MKNGKLQVAVIGCGGIANQKHFPALKTQGNKCEIVAFCDIIPDRAKKAAEDGGCTKDDGCMEEIRQKVYHWLSEPFPKGYTDAV